MPKKKQQMPDVRAGNPCYEAIPRWCIEPPFDTLDACLDFVKKKHPQRDIKCTVIDIETGQQVRDHVPAYLFRGEVGWLSTCLSRCERVRRGHFPGVRQKNLSLIGTNVDKSLQKQLALQPMLSEGLMQHYGWPTEILDATKSLKTASIFARFGSSSSRGQGALAVFDVAMLMKNAKIIDLSQHPSAVRPRRQEAYGIRHSQHRDMKQQQAISDMGIAWYAFRTDPQHCARVASAKKLLTVLDDETAGLLRLSIDGAIEKYGKVCHLVAKYLAEQIAHCPVTMRNTDEGLQAITPSEAGIVVDDREEAKVSLELWSRAHPCVVTRPTPTFRH